MAGIFISYRREDSGSYAGRLYDALITHFDRESVFLDIDTISPGEDFREVILRTCSSCKVMLVIIGRQWAGVTDKHGRVRLDNANDYVRLEIATALHKGLRVIPVLVGGATMPEEGTLPEDLRPLLYHNAWDLSDRRFHQDLQLLTDTLKKTLNAASPLQKPVSSGSGKRSLFPVYGIVLGTTTIDEIKQLGADHYDAFRNSYYVKNTPFLADKTSSKVDRIVLFSFDTIPKPWQDMGFSWHNTQDAWLLMLRELGYTVAIARYNRLRQIFSLNNYTTKITEFCAWPNPHAIELYFKPYKQSSSIDLIEFIDIKSAG